MFIYLKIETGGTVMAIKNVNDVDVFYLTTVEQDEFDKKEEAKKNY